jgi:autoinducer 2-degrading protein
MSEQLTEFCVFLTVVAGNEEKFLEASRRNQAGARREPGNRKFDIYQSSENPRQFLFVEAYDSVASVTQHRETAHFTEWLKAAESMLAEPRTRVPGQDVPTGYAIVP